MAGSADLTSVGIRVLFEGGVFTAAQSSGLPGGGAVPFAPGPFFTGQVYANAVTSPGGDWATAEYVVVSGVGSGGQRPTVAGTGTLASLGLVVTGHPASGIGRIWLAQSGDGAATYTEAQRPGLGRPLAVVGVNPAEVAVAGHGGQPGLDQDALEEADHLADSVIELVDGQQVEPIDLDALSTTATVDAAAVNDPPRIDAVAPMTVSVSASATGPDLRSIVHDPNDAYPDLVVSAVGDEFVAAEIRDGQLWILGREAGEGTVTITAADRAGRRGTAEVAIWVTPRDLAPVLAVPSQVELGVGDTARFEWADLASDPDGALEDLSYLVAASGAVSAQAGAGTGPGAGLAIAGLTEGAGQVAITVRDRGGNVATARIGVVVEPEDGSPVGVSPPGGQPPVSSPGPDPVEPRDPVSENPVSGDPQPGDPSPGSPGGAHPPARIPVYLEDLPDTAIGAGEVVRLFLGDYVRGDEGVSAWSVAGATTLRVELGAGGEAMISAPLTGTGREILVFTVTGVNGGSSSASALIQWDAGLPAPEFGPMPIVEMMAGERRRIALADLLYVPLDTASWAAMGGDLLGARLDGGDLVLEPVTSGDGQVLLTVTDARGQRASEVLRLHVSAPSVPDGPAPGTGFSLVDPAPLTLARGSGTDLSLDTMIETGPADAGLASRVQWSVGAPAGLADLDPSMRVLTLSTTAVDPGNYEVLLTARVGDQVADVVLRVEVLEAEPHLLPQYELEILAGGSEIVLPLDGLVARGSPDSLIWTVSGGLLVTTRIDSATRSLTLGPGAAVPGREVFRLSARTDHWHEEIGLDVSVLAPELSLRIPPVLSGQAGDTARVDLAPYLVGAARTSGLEWRLGGPSYRGASMTPSGVLSVPISGDGVVYVEVVTRWGTVIYGSARVLRLSSRAEDPDTTTTTPRAPSPPLGALSLPGMVELVDGSMRIPLEALLPPGIDASSVATWGVAAQAPGAAHLDGDWLVVEGSGDFALSVSLGLSDGSAYTGTMQVMGSPTDTAAPRVEVRLHVVPESGTVTVEIESDEELREAPLVSANGVALDVLDRTTGWGSHVPQCRSLADVAARWMQMEIEVATQDAHGNTGGISARLACGAVSGTATGTGPGGVQVSAPHSPQPVPVWIHPAHDLGGLYIGFDPAASRSLELQYVSVEPETRLEVLTPAGWEAAPARVVAGSLWASIDASGVYRLTQGAAAPTAPELEVSAFPNPFNAAVALRVGALTPGLYRLAVFDSRGRLVRELSQQVRGAGVWSAVWDGRGATGTQVASGVYLARVQGPAGGVTAKLVLVR